MTMTSKVVPYKAGFGPFAPEVYRTPAPYPFRGVTEDDAIAALKHLFKGDVDPQSVACAVLEPVQGEGGFIPMTPDFPKRLQELLDQLRDPLRRRRGAVGLRPHRPGVGDRALRRRARPARLRQDARRRAAARRRHRPRRGDGRRPARRARRHVRRQPASRAPRRSRSSTRSRAARRAPRQIGARLRERLEAMAPAGSEVRGLGPMVAIELPEQTGDETSAHHARGARAGA